jgi:hemerythrin-like domain-containing protein
MTQQDQHWHGPGLTDVRMMAALHSGFRREIGLSPGLVRAVQPGNLARARVIADHIALTTDLLHLHHSLEDRTLWPRLITRVPTSLTPVVQLMTVQHAALDNLERGVTPLVDRWRQTAAVGDSDDLAAALAELGEAVVVHLDAEETHVLPLLAQHITAQEWADFSAQGSHGIPPAMRSVAFGMMLYEGDPEAIAAAMSSVPSPVRRLLTAAGRRSFSSYARTIHGTSTPERGVGQRISYR